MTVEEDIQALKENADTFFLIVNAILIYFMQCGFAFLECGAVRSKNATNILIKNILDSFFGAIAYWIVGYPLAFGSGNEVLGYEFWASNGLDIGLYAHWFFHFVFAATAATIVSGAVAERCDFIAYIVYSLVITGFMYPVVTHWAWSSEGWLAAGMDFDVGNITMTTTYADFAGSGCVHLLGGTSAFVASAILGPRIGRFDKDGKPLNIRGHSVPLAALGGFILFFGFFAFNGGSQASISVAGDGHAVSLAVVNTILAGSSGGLMALICMRMKQACSKENTTWSLLSTVNGALAGMVAICAGCNVLHPWGAAATGAVAGVNCLLWSSLVLKMGVDDPLDAVAVHAGSGLWGLIAAPLFAKDTGIVYVANKESAMALAWNLVGAAAIIGWSLLISLIVFGLLKGFRLFRVSKDIEKRGLDIPKHGEPAYPLGSYGDGWMNKSASVDDLVKGNRDVTHKATPLPPKPETSSQPMQLNGAQVVYLPQQLEQVFPRMTTMATTGVTNGTLPLGATAATHMEPTVTQRQQISQNVAPSAHRTTTKSDGTAVAYSHYTGQNFSERF